MSLDRPIQDAKDGVEGQVRNLLWWLPEPHECECGSFCTAETEFVEGQALVMPVWVCDSCGRRYHREE